MALWRLPRPDFHRLVDTDFQDTPLTLRPARSWSRHATLSTESSDSFVASAAVSIATGWSEPAPGRELHPLKSSAFSRRTITSTTRQAILLGTAPVADRHFCQWPPSYWRSNLATGKTARHSCLHDYWEGGVLPWARHGKASSNQHAKEER